MYESSRKINPDSKILFFQLTAALEAAARDGEEAAAVADGLNDELSQVNDKLELERARGS